MKDTIKYWAVFLIFFVCVELVQAHNYAFRNIVMSDGLSGLLVNSIYKDIDGFMWLGTDNCLDRFDGVRVKHFEFNGIKNGLKKRVTSITETTNRDLWIGNGVGLWKLNKTTSELERMLQESIDFPVNALLANRDTLYIGTDRGLFIQQEGKLSQILTDKNMLASCNRIMGMCLDKDKSIIWLATMQGLFSYSLRNNKMTSQHFIENVPEADYFRCITRIGDTLYLGTMSQGVVCYDIRKENFYHAPSLGCNVISDISSDGKELVYVATDWNGVHFLSHKKKEIIRSFRHDIYNKEGISSNSVYSLLVDERGGIWIGNFQAGLDYSLYQNGVFHIYSYPPKFDSANMSVRSFIVQGSERVIGSRDGLFYINEATGIVRSFIKPVLISDLVLTICFYEGEYYIGTYGGGMMVLNPKNLSLRCFSEGDEELFRKGHVFCVKPDSKNNLWIGTSQGVWRYSKQTNQIKNFTSSNSQLPDGNVYEITFDSSGKGWIATETGMCIYDPSSQNIRVNVFPDGFIHKDKIRMIYEDSQHLLHFVREKGSLFTSTLTMDRFWMLPPLTLVPDNSIMSVVEDNQKRLWLGCNGGLIRLKNGEKGYDTFTVNDGLPGPTFTNMAAYKDSNGIVWFGNTKGLIYVDTEKTDSIRNNVHSVRITDFLVNGTSVTAPLLNYDQNNITFCFTDFSYGLSSAVLYEYRLDGIDKEWKLLTAQNEVSYYRLSPGTYTFHVRLLQNEKTEATCLFTIRPMIPWWGWVLIVVSIAFVIIMLRCYIWKKLCSRKSTVPILEKEKPVQTYPVEDNALQLQQVTEEKYKTNRMSEQECKELYEKLVSYVEKERPYTNPDLKMGDLVLALNVSSHSLSYVLNQYLNQSYYDFINEYRITEFKKLVTNNQSSRYTLTALAEQCGFSSRASFFRSFKKSMGVTPNEYIRSIGAITKEE